MPLASAHVQVTIHDCTSEARRREQAIAKPISPNLHENNVQLACMQACPYCLICSSHMRWSKTSAYPIVWYQPATTQEPGQLEPLLHTVHAGKWSQRGSRLLCWLGSRQVVLVAMHALGAFPTSLNPVPPASVRHKDHIKHKHHIQCSKRRRIPLTISYRAEPRDSCGSGLTHAPCQLGSYNGLPNYETACWQPRRQT